MLMFQETNPKETEVQASSINYGGYVMSKVDESFMKAIKDWNIKNAFLTPLNALGDAILQAFDPTKVYGRLEMLDRDQARLRATLGLGSQKADEFRKLVADGAGSFTLMGETIDKVGETYTDLVKVFKADISTTADNLAELRATEKVTGVEVGVLAENFRNVGVSINEVGENMMDVAKVAREAGVSVAEVSKNVVANLSKMNIYNFENGVKGLAKMSAQAARLGIDMTEVFKVVDKVFNPEGAIELAASLQRLGVSAGALLDPLRLMDLSQNDPTELQNQIVNMSKEFVRFNKDLNQFEIMPGEKRRLAEINTALGLADGTIQKMAINSANLEMKMKQIKFPSSLASKEDRELIATLAQVNKLGVAEIKVARFDEKGERTGEFDMVEVSELNAAQLEAIKEDQELRGKTMEEIAYDQLSELQKLSRSFEAIGNAFSFGISTSKPITSSYDLATKGTREELFGETGKVEQFPELYRTGFYRENLDSLDDIKNMAIKVTGIVQSFADLDFEDIASGMNMIKEKLTDVFSQTFDYIKNKAKEFGIGGVDTEFGMGGVDTDLLPSNNATNISQKITKENLTENLSKISFDPLKIEQETKITMDVKLPPEFGQNTPVTDAILKWFEEVNNQAVVIAKLKQFENQNGLK